MIKALMAIVVGVITIIGGIFGLVQYGIISQEIGVVVIIILLAFFICFQELAKKIQKIVDKIDLFRNPLAEIQIFLGRSTEFVPVHPVKSKGFTETKSPTQLTNLGEKLLDESGAKKAIDDNFDELEEKINEKNFKNAYDVQSYISRFVAKLGKKDFMIPIKNFVYKNPNYGDVELELIDVQRAMLVYLRDKYLEKHSEILKNH